VRHAPCARTVPFLVREPTVRKILTVATRAVDRDRLQNAGKPAGLKVAPSRTGADLRLKTLLPRPDGVSGKSALGLGKTLRYISPNAKSKAMKG